MSERFNRLALLDKDVGRTGDGHRVSLWKCDCGSLKKIAYSRVKSGASKSCGCLSAEVSRAAAKHGARRTGCVSPEYSSWMAMRTRCNNPNSKDYPRYGGRGISICDRWGDFSLFLHDMGERPEGKTLERIDSMKAYEPGNVKWGDHFEQARNRRSSLSWKIKGLDFDSISLASVHFGVSQHTISRWVNGGFDERRGTFTEPRKDCFAERKY